MFEPYALMKGMVPIVHVRCFFFQAEDGIRDYKVTGVQTCALPIFTVTALLMRAHGVATPTAVVVDSKSLAALPARTVAVLPFENLSAEPDSGHPSLSLDRKSVV